MVGIAGGRDKCRHAVEVLGFDACIDRHDPGFAQLLTGACQDGIDVYFENVGGAVLQAVLPLLNLHARMPVCGFVAHYNDDDAPHAGPDHLPQLLATVLQKRVRMEGFIILDHYGPRFDAFRDEMSGWVAAGQVKLHEQVVQGLEHAPIALADLLQGRHKGKLLVQVAA